MADIRAHLHELLAERILVLDGAWGVLIHRKELTEAEYRVSASMTIRATSAGIPIS